MEKSITYIKINFKYIWKGNIREAAAEGRRSPSVARPEAVLPFKMYFEFTFNSPCTFYVIFLCTFSFTFFQLAFHNLLLIYVLFTFCKRPKCTFLYFFTRGDFSKNKEKKGWLGTTQAEGQGGH